MSDVRRHGLMIAIDDYPKLQPRFQLKGCVNDMNRLRPLLVDRFDFDEEDIETLTNGAATREGILAALERLVARASEGDLVFISYQGHGGRLREKPGEEDEDDGYDSTLVPTDSDRPRTGGGSGGPNLDITDDELFLIFQRLRGKIGDEGHLVLYFDCCHSGTMSRDIEGETGRQVPEDDRWDGVERPHPFAGATGRGDAAPSEKGTSGWLAMDEGYVLIAGCHDTEIAREYRDPATNQKYGALTYFLSRELESASGTVTYYDVMERARAQVTAQFPAQHPQIEGDWGRPLFGVDRLQIEPFSRLSVDGPTRVRLKVGAAQRATVGSRWVIRPPELTDDTTLAEVRIISVGPLESVAESDEPLPETVNDRCRAVEVEHDWGEFRLPVAVEGADAEAVAALQAKIEASPLLALPATGPVDVVAVLLAPRDTVDPLVDFAPELEPVEEPTWVLTGADRALLPVPLHAATEEDVLETTLANLETWARFLQVRRLVPPPGGDPLRGKFQVRLRRFNPGGANDDFPAHPTTGLPMVEEGDALVLEMTNTHDKPLHFVLLNLDPDGGVSRAYPPSGAGDALEPGANLILGQRGEAVAALPEKMPAALDGAVAGFKIMLTLDPVNYDGLFQEGARDLSDEPEIPDVPAAGLLDAASRGGFRFAAPVAQDEAAEGVWGAEHLYFWVRRKG